MPQTRRKKIEWILANHRGTIKNYLKLMDEYENKYGIISEKQNISDPEEWILIEQVQELIAEVKDDFMDEFLCTENVALNTIGIARRLISRGKA